MRSLPRYLDLQHPSFKKTTGGKKYFQNSLLLPENLSKAPWGSYRKSSTEVFSGSGKSWGAANGGLRDGGLRKSEDIWGKRPFSSVFWIFQVLFSPSGKGQKRQKKGEKGWFQPISGKGGQTPLKPPFVTPPFTAAQKSSPIQERGASVGGGLLQVLGINFGAIPGMFWVHA